MGDDMGLAGLADAIEALRTELLDAVSRGRGKSLQFTLAPIQISVQTVLSKTAGGKLNWHVLGIDGKVESQHVHTLTLSLDPRTQEPDGSLIDVHVADDLPLGAVIRTNTGAPSLED